MLYRFERLLRFSRAIASTATTTSTSKPVVPTCPPRLPTTRSTTTRAASTTRTHRSIPVFTSTSLGGPGAVSVHPHLDLRVVAREAAPPEDAVVDLALAPGVVSACQAASPRVPPAGAVVVPVHLEERVDVREERVDRQRAVVDRRVRGTPVHL